MQTEDALNAACRQSFDAFAQRAFRITNPGTKYEWNWHTGCVAEHLEASFRGEIKRLIINIPPRTLKSYLCGEAFPAWVMGKEPWRKFIVTSFGHSLAKDRAQKCRYILQDEWYKRCFPEVEIDNTQNEKHNFQTTKHGGYYAAGILGTITGKGADYLLVDDPLKPDEAVSDTIRLHTNEAFRNTLFSRFNDDRDGRFIMIMQRLHEDDPTGHLLAQGGYHILKLPAEAHKKIIIDLGKKRWEMQPGDLLFPNRLTPEILRQKRDDLGEYNYAGQFLQEPVPIGGGEFRANWIQRYPLGSIKAREMNICILVDPAGERKRTSDWTAMMVVGKAPDNNYYLLDAVRDRLNPTDRINTLFLLHQKWNNLGGKPPKVGYEKYGMMTDTHYIMEKQRLDGYRFPLVELGGSQAKEDRIRRLIPDMQTGRWYFPDNLLYTDNEGRTFDLVREVLECEMPTFPRARYDDMLDALSRVYDEAIEMPFPRQGSGAAKKQSRVYSGATQHWANL